MDRYHLSSLTTAGGKDCNAWGQKTIYNANPGATPGTVAINVVDCKQSLSDINAALVLNTAFQNTPTFL